MTSNYPPGVRGNEYAITGPTFEREESRFCDVCREERSGMVYQEPVAPRTQWWTCDECAWSEELNERGGVI